MHGGNLKLIDTHSTSVLWPTERVPVHSIKVYRGNRGKAPFIRYLELDGGEWSALSPHNHNSHYMGGGAGRGHRAESWNMSVDHMLKRRRSGQCIVQVYNKWLLRLSSYSHIRVTALSAKRPKNRCSITSAGKRTFLWGPPSFLFSGHRDSFPEVKQPEREVDHSLYLLLEFKNAWCLSFFPPYSWTGATLP